MADRTTPRVSGIAQPRPRGALHEYKIVALLGRHAGKVVTYDYLLKEVWEPYAAGNNQLLRVNMANIRRKIEKNRLIRNTSSRNPPSATACGRRIHSGQSIVETGAVWSDADHPPLSDNIPEHSAVGMLRNRAGGLE
jgi:hypothetical protein